MNNIDFVFLRIMNEINTYFRKLLPNFPKKEIVLKNAIEKNLYDMFENIFAFNINTTSRIKEKNLKDFLIKLAMLDIYIKDAFHSKYITAKQMKVLANREMELRKIAFTLMKGLNKSE